MQNKIVNNKIIQYKPISIIIINIIIAIAGIIIKSQHNLLPEILLPIVYGFSIFSAALIISWAAESSEKDISGSFVIAIIALIAGNAGFLILWIMFSDFRFGVTQ